MIGKGMRSKEVEAVAAATAVVGRLAGPEQL
jgi:hypothetical protein